MLPLSYSTNPQTSSGRDFTSFKVRRQGYGVNLMVFYIFYHLMSSLYISLLNLFVIECVEISALVVQVLTERPET